MKVVFMGTPDFARASLEALISSKHEVMAVVTKIDKPKGRGKNLAESPVKELAKEYGIKIHQPKKVRDEEFVEILRDYKPDAIVVVAFGQIIPRQILEIPKYGCINIHGSILPKYRGAAPIQWAILNGEKETGITSMQMDEGLDTGDILLINRIKIDEEETSGSLFEKMKSLGAKTLIETLDGLEKGEIVGKKQGESTTEYAVMLDKKMGNIDFNKNSYEIDNLVRGMNPWPSAYTRIDNKILKIWRVKKSPVSGEIATILEVNKDSFLIGCKDGSVEVLELQLEGKKRMQTAEFLKGFKLSIGMKLGE